MANTPKKIIRKVLSGRVLRLIEDEYRLARATYANARFNWPAKDMRVIMITGTNGKTTTAHYLFSILRKAGFSVGLLSTAEFRVNDKVQVNDTNMTAIEPVPLRRYLAEFKAAQTDYVVLEATSQALDQYRLWGIPCEVAVFTNLTQDHLDYHKTMERYAAAKAKLWKLKPKISVLNADDEWFGHFKKIATGKLYTYGKKNADIGIESYEADGTSATFVLNTHDGKVKIRSNLSGEYNVYNATAAATAALGIGVSLDDIEAGIENLAAISGRLQKVPIDKPFTVLVDYAHTPDGLKKLLQAGRDMTKKDIWLVFGACGDRDKTKRPIMGEIAAKYADKIVVTDEESYNENPKIIRKAILKGIATVKNSNKKVIEIADRKSAIMYALQNAKNGDLILITGLGHEQFRIEQGKRIPWNDAEVVKQSLK